MKYKTKPQLLKILNTIEGNISMTLRVVQTVQMSEREKYLFMKTRLQEIKNLLDENKCSTREVQQTSEQE